MVVLRLKGAEPLRERGRFWLKYSEEASRKTTAGNFFSAGRIEASKLRGCRRESVVIIKVPAAMGKSGGDAADQIGEGTVLANGVGMIAEIPHDLQQALLGGGGAESASV